MRSWSYKAITPQGKEVNGKLEAKTQAEAEEMLNGRRMRIVSLKKDPIEISIKLGSGISAKDISRFTRQFSSMCSAGLPILQCIDILADQAENLSLREVLKKISTKIQGGSSLSEAMKEHPKVFNPLYVHMVAAGEAGGILDEVLRRQADYQEANNRLRAKIKKAMTYPILLTVVAVGAMIVLLTFVVPIFADMFTASGNALPGPTQFVINLSNFLKQYLPFIAIAVVGAIVGIKQYKKTPSGAKVLDGLKMKLPGVGPVETKGSVARFTRTLGTLLNAGVSIIDSLKVTANTAGNAVIEEAIMKVVQSISGGQNIAEPLKETGVFPAMVISMIAVGEKTGGLSEMLSKIADFYDEEVNDAVDAMTSMMEPAILVVMGGGIGGLMIAMYMPMFSMADTAS
ncbi:MAG: type II secretion system F family protein [Fibrobacterales bacterium]|nr:type II secretion system F family protein [Fibrobacterales bacterium]MBP5351383.1 type II secretion system F family protein [Fibrobacterales bacterium]